MDALDHPVAIGAQHVLHLHGLDHGERFAGLDLLPFTHGNGDDQAGHRAAHRLAGIDDLLRGHQPRRRRFALGIDVGAGLDPVMGEIESVEHRAHLHGYGPPVHAARPHGIAGLPC